jgi:hypothetical protein
VSTIANPGFGMIDSTSRCPVHFTAGFIFAGHERARCPRRPDEVFHSVGSASLIAALSVGCLGVVGAVAAARVNCNALDAGQLGAAA